MNMGVFLPRKDGQKGFTLIEIMLVLAIAGAIFVIVFLAVQGAQRGRRDTERRAAVGRALAAAEQIASNNDGAYPGDCTTGGNNFGGVYNDQGGKYTCDGSSAAHDKIQYTSGEDCHGNSDTNFIKVEVVLETGNVTFCQDNN